MDLLNTTVVDGHEAEICWSFYDRAFEPLRTRAAQRHALTRDEFDEQMIDGRVSKHVAYENGIGSRPVGLATLTNDLKAVPLIAPEYYEARWPQFYAQQQIWYVGFLVVDPDFQGAGVLTPLIGSVCSSIAPGGGILAADICEFNEEAVGLPETFARVLSTFRQPETLRLDAQVFWAYEFASSI